MQGERAYAVYAAYIERGNDFISACYAFGRSFTSVYRKRGHYTIFKFGSVDGGEGLEPLTSAWRSLRSWLGASTAPTPAQAASIEPRTVKCWSRRRARGGRPERGWARLRLPRQLRRRVSMLRRAKGWGCRRARGGRSGRGWARSAILAPAENQYTLLNQPPPRVLVSLSFLLLLLL